MKRQLNKLSLSKIKEVSMCASWNPPANGFKSFDIIKNSIKKDAYEDLFEELKMPEYGDFLSYLDCWLEEDVNRVAYAAFLDALFGSLQDIVWDESLDKAGKSAKFKETFDSFIKEYENSVITKSEDGKVKLNINKSKDVDIKKYYGECIAEQYGREPKTFSEAIAECAPNRINNSLWDMFTYKLQDKIFDIHYLDESKYSKEDKAKMLTELFTEFVQNFNDVELIKSNKQEKKVKDSILKKLQNFVADLSKSEEATEEEVVETQTEEVETQETEVVETPAETEVQEPEQTETPAEEVAPESEEPTQEPTGEEAPAESTTEEPEAPQEEAQEPEQTEEVVEEAPAVEKSTDIETDDEIVKAQTKITELEQQVLDLQKSQKEQEIKLEKAEILKEVAKDYVGLPQTKDEVVEALYELNKASLSEVSKKFILESLKSLSDLNKESFEELGHSEEVDVNKSAEDIVADKVKKAMQDHDILEEQALLVVTEGRSIAKAKEVTEIVRKRKN